MATITAKHAGDMLFDVTVGKHTIQMDVPDSMHGKDRAMTPPQVTIASLAGCIAAFVTNYCRNAGIDATDLSVDVSFDKTEQPSCLTNMKATIHIPHGDIAGRENAILKVANSCPVHYTLCHTDSIAIALAEQVVL
ncbi:MAG TPA: OsmC family protein [bacterium]|nr:OsmC family protein [bacterium]